MSNVDCSVDDVHVELGRNGKLDVQLSGVDDDEMLGQLDDGDIATYAANNLMADVVEEDKGEAIECFSWDEVKNHFSVDIISEAVCSADDVLDEIGWDYIRKYFNDEIDSEVSDRVEDIISRETA